MLIIEPGEACDMPKNTEAAPDPVTLAANLIRKVDAGAQLVHALYHMPVEWWRQELPRGLLAAYRHAYDAYGIRND
jgi:hypothetical protein